MSKQTNQNTPPLRFPGFKGNWEKKKLGEVAEINPTNKNLPKKFIYIDLESVSNGELLIENEITIENAPSRAQRILKANDVLFQMVRPYQKNNLFFDKKGIYVASTGYAQIRTEQNPRYLFQYLHVQLFVDKVIERCTGTSYPAINSNDLSNIEISFPSLPEQQRIASFLTAVDEKITRLKQKKTLLEQYKKGMMQKLFSQQLRFKDDKGKAFPNWEVKKLGEYIKLYRGSSPRPINLFTTKKSTGVNWIKIGDTKNCKNYLIGSVEEKITIEGAKKSREVYKGELILANSMSFGKTYLLGIDGCIYDGWFVLREFESNFNKQFLHQLLNSDYLQKQYKTLSTGGVVQNISSEIVYDTYLLRPSLPEQEKIATFLSSIDEKINHTQTQLEKTEAWKKGLLQKMFV